MGEYNGYTANASEGNDNTNTDHYGNNNNNNNYPYATDANALKSHYRTTSDIAANVKLGTPNSGDFHQGLYQSPPSALHATPIPQPPQHPLMSLPPPITSAMNSCHSKPPHSSVNNIYHHNQSPNNHYNDPIEHSSFTLRASPHFQMLSHNRSQSLGSNIHHDTLHQYGGGADAAFNHVPHSHINGYPLSQPKPTLPLPANHHQQQLREQQQQQQQQQQQYDAQDTEKNRLPSQYTSNNRFDSLLYHMGQQSQSNSQFVRQFLHHLNPNHSVNLKFIKDLNTMMENWTEEEMKASRRLVKFDVLHGENSNNTMQMINFEAIKAVDYGATQAVISCIYWQEKKKFICTSVDIILLLEYLVHQSFGIEEKNRIRRNLQSLKPTTVSRSNKNDREFFSLIMSMENPRPRNIEKDLKVFNWNDLGKAIAKVMSKYYVVSSPSPGSSNLWCNGGHQLHNVPLSGTPGPEEGGDPPPTQARHTQVTHNNNAPYHGSPPASYKPNLPPLALIAPISESSTPMQSQFPQNQSPSYPENRDVARHSSSAPNLQNSNYQGDPNRHTDLISPLSAQHSGTPLENSSVCRQVTPTYHTKESKQQYHHRYYYSPAGLPVTLPPPRLYPSSKFSYSRDAIGGTSTLPPPPPPPPPHVSNGSAIESSHNSNSITAFGGLNSSPNDSPAFASKEELLLDSDKFTSKFNPSRGAVSSSGEYPPTTNYSQSPSPGKEIEGDTSSGSERCCSSNDGDDMGSALSGNSKASGANSDDNGQTSNNSGTSKSASSLSSDSKDSSSLISLHRDSGNSSEESTRSNSVPGSGKFAPLSFNNNNNNSNSCVSLLGSNGGTSTSTSSTNLPKSNLRSLIDPQQSPIMEHKVEEGGEPEEDDGIKDEDESMEDELDDTDEGNNKPTRNKSLQPASKKRKRKSQRKMSSVGLQHQVQNNATSQYFDNNRDKKYMSTPGSNGGNGVINKPQLPPISQILKSELYSNDNGPISSPAPQHHQSPIMPTSDDPLIRQVQNWKDY